MQLPNKYCYFDKIHKNKHYAASSYVFWGPITCALKNSPDIAVVLFPKKELYTELSTYLAHIDFVTMHSSMKQQMIFIAIFPTPCQFCLIERKTPA
jgi:hypothetical protein